MKGVIEGAEVEVEKKSFDKKRKKCVIEGAEVEVEYRDRGKSFDIVTGTCMCLGCTQNGWKRAKQTHTHTHTHLKIDTHARAHTHANTSTHVPERGPGTHWCRVGGWGLGV